MSTTERVTHREVQNMLLYEAENLTQISVLTGMKIKKSYTSFLLLL